MIKFLVILALFTVAHGQRGSFQGTMSKPLCAGEGNYCTANADCCSKACLTDSHKCTVSYGPGIALLDKKPTTASSLDNRFGNEGNVCRQDGDNCQIGRDCCSGECLTSLRKCIRSNEIQKFPINNSGDFEGQKEEPQPVCSRENQQCSPSQNCCTFLSCERNVCRDNSYLIVGTETLGFVPSNNLTNRFGEEENAANQTEVTSAPEENVKCAEIGSKCYKESDCCQKLRCHGFLHKCVT